MIYILILQALLLLPIVVFNFQDLYVPVSFFYAISILIMGIKSSSEKTELEPDTTDKIGLYGTPIAVLMFLVSIACLVVASASGFKKGPQVLDLITSLFTLVIYVLSLVGVSAFAYRLKSAFAVLGILCYSVINAAAWYRIVKLMIDTTARIFALLF